METFWQDIRHSLRVLIRRPGFTVAAIATLALGIGVNSLVFSVINAVLLRPLDFKDPSRLVAVFATAKNRTELRNPTSPANFIDWREQSTVFEEMAAAHPWSPTIIGRESSEIVQGLKVSFSLFRMLGVEAAHGRTFLPENEGFNEDRTLVLSHGLWQSRFGGDPNLIGQAVSLDGEPYTIIGIMPPGFEFPPFWATGAGFWTPLNLSEQDRNRRGAEFLRVFARLKTNVSISQAQAGMDSIARRLEEMYPDDNSGEGVNVEPLQEPVVSDVRAALWTLQASVVFVLLIACTNVANLLLARSTVRQREIAVRASLGASRWRLLRQLLTENLLIALGGGCSGLLVSLWGMDFLSGLNPQLLPRVDEVGFDGRVFAFLLAMTLIAALLFGLIPAFRILRVNLSAATRETAAGRGTTGRYLLQKPLIVAQMALALALLAGAGVLIKNLLRLQEMDPGFRTNAVLTMTISRMPSTYDGWKANASSKGDRTQIHRGSRLWGWSPILVSGVSRMTCVLKFTSPTAKIRLPGKRRPAS